MKTIYQTMAAGLLALALAATSATAGAHGDHSEAAQRNTPIWIATATTAAMATAGPHATTTPANPTVVPTPAPPPDVATIMLYVSGAPDGAWTVVQWQDGSGSWHDVDGWSGPLDPGWRGAAWAVFPKHFGLGPFRWLVRAPGTGAVIKASTPFRLPPSAGTTLAIWLITQSGVIE